MTAQFLAFFNGSAVTEATLTGRFHCRYKVQPFSTGIHLLKEDAGRSGREAVNMSQ